MFLNGEKETMQTDFTKNPFAGRGDGRIIGYKTDFTNAANAALMTDFLKNGYVRKDDAAKATKMELEKLEEQMVNAVMWTNSNEGKRWLDMVDTNNRIDEEAEAGGSGSATASSSSSAAAAAAKFSDAAIKAAARPPECMHLTLQELSVLKMLQSKLIRHETEIAKCAEATEKMFIFINATVTGELKSEWDKMQRVPDTDRVKMVKAFLERLSSGTYLEAHKAVRDRELARLSSYAPDKDGHTAASIGDVDKLDAFLVLESDVRQKIKQHADETRSMKDTDGRALVAAPAATDHSRMEMLKDALAKNHDTVEAIKMVDDAMRTAIADYEALRERLFTWISQNRKSKPGKSAEEAPHSSSSSSSSGGGGGGGGGGGSGDPHRGPHQGQVDAGDDEAGDERALHRPALRGAH